MAKVMIFTHPSEPTSFWRVRNGRVSYHAQGFKHRATPITHAGLHDPRYGFKFKELRDE